MRLLSLAIILAIVLAAALVFQVKTNTGQSAARVIELEQRIEIEHKNILMLKAEFSTLSQPQRMQKILEKYPEYFPLVQTSPEHFVNPNKLPNKVVVEFQYENENLGGLASNISNVR